MPTQTTILTCHKGVDLHAETARRVMRERLAGGRRLVDLRRGEYATFWGPEQEGLSARDLLQVGRIYNPNKHRYGHFLLASGGEPWYGQGNACCGNRLLGAWPGQAVGCDLGEPDSDLYDRLLGTDPVADLAVVDVCTFALGEPGPLLTGVIWRLIMPADGGDVDELADSLIVTRNRRVGLLVNPHLQGWLVARRSASPRSRHGPFGPAHGRAA